MHYPNMQGIPTYALYGEKTDSPRQERLHWETIQSRSRLHDYCIAPHRHERVFQVIRLTAGRAQALLDGEAHELGPSAVVVVPSGTVHGYRFSEDVDGIVLSLMQKDVREDDLGFSDARVLSGDLAGVDAALANLIAEADRPGREHDAAMRSLIVLLLVALHRLDPGPAPSGGPPTPAREHVQRFRTLVDRGFRQTRRVGDYAAELGISRTHLNRLCRQVLGASALDVIEARAILEARRQLLFTALPIQRIGSDLGYPDPAYFSRVVTRVLGVSPSRFRDLHARI